MPKLRQKAPVTTGGRGSETRSRNLTLPQALALLLSPEPSPRLSSILSRLVRKTMESLAYLQLCLIQESSTEQTAEIVLKPWSARTIFLSVALALGILGGVSKASAQSFGDSGDDVMRIQFRLQAIGYSSVQPTGFYDSNTQQAILDFQRRNGLEADGVVGRQTRPVLFNTFDPIFSAPTNARSIPPLPPTINSSSLAFPPEGTSYSPPPLSPPALVNNSTNLLAVNSIGSSGGLRRGDRSEAVRQLQLRLRDLGYYYDDIDGIYGLNTEDAVTRFQVNRGLFPDGIAGSQTLAALGLSNIIEQNDRRYVVVVPGDFTQLAKVRQFYTSASLKESRRGSYVEAGRFGSRNEAESHSYYLRALGFDARVAYNP